jgi:hypothetical protein
MLKLLTTMRYVFIIAISFCILPKVNAQTEPTLPLVNNTDKQKEYELDTNYFSIPHYSIENNWKNKFLKQPRPNLDDLLVNNSDTPARTEVPNLVFSHNMPIYQSDVPLKMPTKVPDKNTHYSMQILQLEVKPIAGFENIE